MIEGGGEDIWEPIMHMIHLRALAKIHEYNLIWHQTEAHSLLTNFWESVTEYLAVEFAAAAKGRREEKGREEGFPAVLAHTEVVFCHTIYSF